MSSSLFSGLGASAFEAAGLSLEAEYASYSSKVISSSFFSGLDASAFEAAGLSLEAEYASCSSRVISSSRFSGLGASAPPVFPAPAGFSFEA